MHMYSSLTSADQRALGCDMALVHDDDLARIIEICDDTVSEHFEQGNVVHYVFVVTGRPPT